MYLFTHLNLSESPLEIRVLNQLFISYTMLFMIFLQNNHSQRWLTLRNAYTLLSFFPFTSIFSINFKLGSNVKLCPGRTHLSPFIISYAFSPGSWRPNWLQGKARTFKSHLLFFLELYFCSNSFNCLYCMVKPQYVATFITKATWFLWNVSGTFKPWMSSIEKS